MIRIMALVAGVLAVKTTAPLLVATMPPERAYTISETCKWSPRPWARLLGADEAPGSSLGAERLLWGCRHARGEMSRSPFVNTILPVWPSASQRRTWEMTDEDRDPLPAEGPDAAQLPPRGR